MYTIVAPDPLQWRVFQSDTWVALRATSHTRLRARDYYTSSTLVGGKGGAGLSLLHTTFEGPMNQWPLKQSRGPPKHVFILSMCTRPQVASNCNQAVLLHVWGRVGICI